MKIENSDVLGYLRENTGKRDNDSLKFKKELDEKLKSARKKSGAVSDEDVEKFKKDLTKLGASGYLAAMNSDKIEQKIAAKRKELEEMLGLNDKNKSSAEIKELQIVLEKMLEDYRKELNIALNSSALLEKQQQLKNSSNINASLASALAQFGV